jgi:hypothetical protein
MTEKNKYKVKASVTYWVEAPTSKDAAEVLSQKVYRSPELRAGKMTAEILALSDKEWERDTSKMRNVPLKDVGETQRFEVVDPKLRDALNDWDVHRDPTQLGFVDLELWCSALAALSGYEDELHRLRGELAETRMELLQFAPCSVCGRRNGECCTTVINNPESRAQALRDSVLGREP